MKITKHAQSCFLVETGNSRVLIDPGNYVFEKENMKPEDFLDIDAVLITHEHQDHLDIEALKIIIQNNSPMVFGTNAVIELLVKEIGHRIEHELSEDLKIEPYPSKHGPLPTGAEPPHVKGFIIDDGEVRFYTPGDTVELNPNAKADIIAVPICGHGVVMDIAQAKNELLKYKPKIAIPIHYDNPMFPVKVEDFIKAMEGTDIQVKVLNFGETLDTENV